MARNVWFDASSLVDQDKWRGHAKKWRKSIDADHGSPDGEGTIARYANGTPFSPKQDLIEEAIHDIIHFVEKRHSSIEKLLKQLI